MTHMCDTYEDAAIVLAGVGHDEFTWRICVTGRVHKLPHCLALVCVTKLEVDRNTDISIGIQIC